MPAGTSTSTNPDKAFTIQVPEACAGREVSVTNDCGDCGEVGEVINTGICNGDSNVLNVCNDNGTLVAC